MRAPIKPLPPRRRVSDAARRRFFHSRIWRRLTSPAPEELKPGTVFRFPAACTVEPVVDYLLIEHPGASGFAMIVASGRRAGTLGSVLPADAVIGERGETSVSRSWVISNWQYRIFDGCSPRDVMIADNYPAPR